MVDTRRGNEKTTRIARSGQQIVLHRAAACSALSDIETDTAFFLLFDALEMKYVFGT